MKILRYQLLLLCLLVSSFLTGELTEKNLQNQVLYLMQAGHTKKALSLYQSLAKENQKHDFDTLEQIGHILLDQGALSGDSESQLLSMYGASMAGTLESMTPYEKGMKNFDPHTQLATIQLLRGLQDDRVEDILQKAFSSPHLIIQLEAAYTLALRRSLHAPGIIDSLMQKLPPQLHVYFPELFAMIGTADAMGILKRLMGSSHLPVRLAAFLSAAKYGRDDFLSIIRTSLTHSDKAELETCAAAAGFLQDSHSIPALKKLASSSSEMVQLAACRSLIQLGYPEFKENVYESAQNKNPFAITLLGEVPGSHPLLIKLLKNDHFYVRVNAALSLLRQRKVEALPILMQMLLQKEKDLGFQPVFSPGHSLMTWKVVPHLEEYAKKAQQDIPSLTLALQEQILMQALELPEKSFLALAEMLFEKKVHSLIPLTVHLLENLKTPDATMLLQKESERTGAPFIRTYCHLGLYRLHTKEKKHRDALFQWIVKQKDHELIQFRPVLPWTERTENSGYQLTPEETSRLLVESLMALADKHDFEGIDTLLSVLKDGNQKNRYALAGLLLKSIQ